MNFYQGACIAGRGDAVPGRGVVCGRSYRWASGSGLPGLPSASLGEAKGKKREDETTGGSGHAFCQSLRLASPVALSNLLLINNKKTA